MEDIEWGRTYYGRSDHIVKTATRVPNRYISLCGKTIVGDLKPLPGVRQCEN